MFLNNMRSQLGYVIQIRECWLVMLLVTFIALSSQFEIHLKETQFVVKDDADVGNSLLITQL
jgi:hypothetical protein